MNKPIGNRPIAAIEDTWAKMNHWVAIDPYFKDKDVQVAMHVIWEYDDQLRVALGLEKKGAEE